MERAEWDGNPVPAPNPGEIMSSRKSRLFASLAAALVVAACSELPPAPLPPAPPPPPAPVASVTVSPGAPSILVGTVVQLSATTKDAQGNTLSSRAITWSSSAEAVATVNATGLVTGVSAGGPVTITATSEGQPGTTQVTVTAPLPVAAVTVSPGAQSIVATSTAQLSATTRDAQGNTLTGRVVSWSSSAEAVATVNATGLVTAVSAGGPVTITATSEGQIGTAQVTVTAPAPTLGFSISLSSAALSIVQGTSTPTTTVNITRYTHLGGVGLYLTGLPTGVTASFDPSSWPAANSSVLTLTVGAAAVPGVYNLYVNAYDPEQDGDVSAPLTLTVTAPPPAPGYTLSLSAPTLGIAQSAWGSSIVHLARTNFSGNVTLSVENLPTGVGADFQPENFPIPGSPPVIRLFVARNALPGTYTDLLVRGLAFGLSDRTAQLTLTITVAPFILTLSSSTLSIVQGAATPTTTVNVVRHDFAGPVTLYVSGDFDEDGALPPGVTVAFSTNPVTGDSSVLTVSVGAATVPGVYPLWVSGEASTGWFVEILTLTVTAASP